MQFLYFLWACNRWLSIRCDFASAIIALASGSFILFYQNSISSSLAGLILTYALGFSSNILVLLFFDLSGFVVTIPKMK